MEEHFEEVIRHEWYKEDFKTIASHIKEQENLLRLKRRWLMDLPLSKKEQQQIEELLPPNDRILPESLLREDDVCYENIKTFVEKGFGACEREIDQVAQEDIQSFDLYNDYKEFFHLLDDMTNRGLCSFLEILTGGMIKFEKTNWRMKTMIKDYLKTRSGEKNDNSETKLKLLCQLLEDPKNFRINQVALSSRSKSYHSAAIKVLDGLEDMPFRTLSAMHRKLRGVRYIPNMQSPKSGWRRDSLISVVRKRCMKMLLELGEGDETPEPLANALAVAGLTLKLIHNTPSVIDFRKFSPETEALQNDIAKAIWLLDDVKKVSLIELKKLQFLLDPSTELSDRSLRMAVRNLLTDYLFECSDMDNVPDCLLEILSIINRRSQLPSRRKRLSSKVNSSSQELMKEEIKNEVECILIVSAQAKQIVWDLLSEHRLDQDFAQAYMEDSEESEMAATSDDDNEEELSLPELYRFRSHDPDNQMESIGETNLAGTNSPASTSETDNCSPLLSHNERLNYTLGSMHINEADSVESFHLVHSPSCIESKMCVDMQNMDRNQHPSGSTGELRMACTDMLLTAKENVSTPVSPDKNSNRNDVVSQEISSNSAEIPKYEFSGNFSGEQSNIVNNHSKAVNQYLEVQDACDKTSIVAYDLIGYILDEFSKIEGIDLYQGDRSYLRNFASVPQYSEVLRNQMASSKDDVLGSIFVQALDELLPSFPESFAVHLLPLQKTIIYIPKLGK
ncbi:uncharacterized protein LOC111405906 isoform X2 [Olea europaea var. sylvestris]|uniref:uncharacterized protein LOC111405906 isoform X2 n=1 Tax=Olea europaea var. sylvestris TaxID=158386 RepID=UPI000C1D7EFF|nr:uncharacterized protein LOC111405906 isoform X2 [Olea europaea var. sylvestris]